MSTMSYCNRWTGEGRDRRIVVGPASSTSVVTIHILKNWMDWFPVIPDPLTYLRLELLEVVLPLICQCHRYLRFSHGTTYCKWK